MIRNNDNTKFPTGVNVKTFRQLRFVILFCAIAIGCGCRPAASSNAVKPAANVAISNTAESPANTTASTPSSDVPVTFSLATPTDAYKTAYALREKKDVNGLKRVMSKDVLEFFEMMAKEEKKTVDEEISEMFNQPQGKTPDSRNEKITGNTASVEYRNPDGEWRTMDFVKEGADWKMTMPKANKPGPAEH
jgi:hypothetical protein